MCVILTSNSLLLIWPNSTKVLGVVGLVEQLGEVRRQRVAHQIIGLHDARPAGTDPPTPPHGNHGSPGAGARRHLNENNLSGCKLNATRGGQNDNTLSIFYKRRCKSLPSTVFYFPLVR